MAALGLIFLITLLLIIYGSLYPFHFHPGPASPVWALLHSWPATIDRFEIRDIAVNILIYLPVGFFGATWLGKRKQRYGYGPALTILLATALSVSVEMLQFFDAAREASMSDVASNVFGAALGVLSASLYGRTLTQILLRPGLLAAVHPSGAMLLGFCWFLYQIYPFFPQTGLYMIRVKLAALWRNFELPAVPVIGAISDWLAVALLVEVIAGEKLESLLLPVAMMLIPARIMIVGRSFTWAEAAGTLCAWAIWRVWLRCCRKRDIILAWLAATLLLLRGLAPYYWIYPGNAFSWIPFVGLLESNWSSAGVVFLNKAFLYGTAVWLFHKAGFSYIRSTVGLAALLAAIEAAQIYLPGRSAEITDPILVVLLAVVLRLLDSSDTRHQQAYSALNG